MCRTISYKPQATDVFSLTCDFDHQVYVENSSVYTLTYSPCLHGKLTHSPPLQHHVMRLSFAKCASRLSSGGFFPVCEDFWRRFDHSFPAYAFFLFFFLFFKVGIRSRTLIPLFRPESVHSSSVIEAETIVAEYSLTSCVRARFPIGSHTMPAQRHSQPTPTSSGRGCMRV